MPCTITVIVPATSQGQTICRTDVKSSFLHGDLDEDIYVEQLQDSSLVCRLQCSLHGLKQAPKAWYEKMNSFLLAFGLTPCHFDPTIYTQRHRDDLLILVLYVDDLILTSSSNSMIHCVQRALIKQFNMINVSLKHYFIGLKGLQSFEGISIF